MNGFLRLISAALFVSSFGAFAEQWDLNDVTYVLPLPTRLLEPSSFRAATDGSSNGQPLIPRNLFGRAFGDGLLKGDVRPRSEDIDPYQDLFAVALRIDPCFKDHFSDSCRPQIRIVWQPVDGWKSSDPKAVDAAVHTFYDLNESEFRSLKSELQRIKTRHSIQTRGLPLGIHPGFSKIRPTPYQRDFKTLLLPYISSMKLRRIALMQLAGASSGWDFFSFEVDRDHGLKSVPIPGFPNDEQQILDHQLGKLLSEPDFRLDAKNRSLRIEQLSKEDDSKAEDDLTGILKDSSKFTENSDDGKTMARMYFDRASRIENPARHLPGTIDCLSCHAANMVKTVTARVASLTPEPPHYPGLNLRNLSKYYGDTHNLRMLGYVDSEMQLGDRVIFESAEVVRAMSEKPDGAIDSAAE